MSKILEAEHLEILNKLELYKKSAKETVNLYQICIEVMKDILVHRFELTDQEIFEFQEIK